MNMQKTFILSFLIFSVALHNTLQAQIFKVVSLDGDSTRIKLEYKTFSKVLAISCMEDTLKLNDYTGTYNVSILNDNFLEITYGARGGSGFDLRNTIILSIRKSKIFASMLVSSYAGVVSSNKKSLYKLKIQLTKDNKNTYKLIVSIYDKQTSGFGHQSNYYKSQQDTLKFDLGQNIFYSTRTNMSKSFTMYDPKTRKEISLKVNQLLPAINLGKFDYYYINDEWYEKGKNNYLIKFSYR